MSLASAVPLTRPDVVGQPSRLSFKVNNFDLIRLFAACQVAIFHTYLRFGLPVPAPLKLIGPFQGVPIFFIISGFLISASYERQTSLAAYARNRALRIFPGLWACVTVTVVVATLFGFSFLSPQALAWFALQLIGGIYTPGFLKGFGDGTYNGSLWTIPLELQFYVVLPVLYWLTRSARNRTGWIALAFVFFLAAGCATKILFPDIAMHGESAGVKLFRYTFVPRVSLFLFGVLLQRLQAHNSRFVRGKALYWLAGYALFLLIVPQDGLVYFIDELILGVTVIAFAYTAPTTAERVLRGNDISYGVYLYHGLVIDVMIELGLSLGGATLPAVLAAAAILGTLSWTLVERPVMRRLKLHQASMAKAAA